MDRQLAEQFQISILKQRMMLFMSGANSGIAITFLALRLIAPPPLRLMFSVTFGIFLSIALLLYRGSLKEEQKIARLAAQFKEEKDSG